MRPGETKSIKVVIESDIKKAKENYYKPEKGARSVVDAEFEYRLNEEVLVKTKSFIYKVNNLVLIKRLWLMGLCSEKMSI